VEILLYYPEKDTEDYKGFRFKYQTLANPNTSDARGLRDKVLVLAEKDPRLRA
jgi:hypothetical protein